jgi:hypothetical protein
MTNGTRRGWGSASRPGRSLPPEKTQYPLYRRLVGPQGRSGQLRKFFPSPGFDPLIVQTVASCYTYSATRPTTLTYSMLEFLRVWHFLLLLPTRLFVTNVTFIAGIFLILNTAHSESDICSVLHIFKIRDLPAGFPHFFLVFCLAKTFVSVFYVFNYQPTAVAISIMSGLRSLCSMGMSMNPVCAVCSFSLRKILC